MALAACGSDDFDLVEATITDPSATLEDIGGLDKGLRGSFTVELHLGPDAENATQALIEVVKVSDPTLDTHHTTLKISTTPEEPWNLNVDSSLVIDASFAAAENAQSQARAEELCAAAGGVVVSLQLIDGLGDSAREVSSDRFQVGGCN